MRESEARDKLRRVTEQWPPFGAVVEDVTIKTSNTDVSHGLGRRYHGFVVIRNDTNTTVADVEHGAMNKKIRLVAGAECQVTLWVL